MVFSVKANKGKIIAILIVVAVVLAGVFLLPKAVESPKILTAETFEQREEFLKGFGWEIDPVEVDSRDVTIPKEFSEVYNTYNVMQNAQGFDLLPYSGLVCKQYIYKVLNYPDTDKEINATLLVYENVIIGGDISCAEVDGFMHGFDKNSAHYGQEIQEDEEPKEESETATGGTITN